MKPLRIIISGGGTGGHIFPAVAIANELKKMVPHAEFLFVGALGRMEMEKVPAAGYKIIGLNIAGFQRRFTFANLSFPFKVIGSLIRAKKIIKDFKPDVAIGTGGYASGPTLKAATAKGIPALIQEQNSFPGITNKILSKKVQRICVAYEGMDKYFPKEKIVLTGNPIRQDITSGNRQEAIDYFKLDAGKKTVLIIGGSLGARTINEAIGAGVKRFVDEGFQVIWQTGKNYFETAKTQTAPVKDKNVFVSDFITRMDLAYAAADVVVSRAGASSVSELSVTGLPSILVPSPNVAEDHQTKNALALVNKSAALLVKDNEAAGKLIDAAISLLKDYNTQLELRRNIAALALKDSAHKIALEVLKLANYPQDGKKNS